MGEWFIVFFRVGDYEIELEKEGRKLLVSKADLDETFKLKDLFDSENTSARVYQWNLEEIEGESGVSKDYVRIKGLEEPIGISFWVIVDTESGKIRDYGVG